MLDLEVTPKIFAPRSLLEVKKDVAVRAQGTRYRAKSTMSAFPNLLLEVLVPTQAGRW